MFKNLGIVQILVDYVISHLATFKYFSCGVTSRQSSWGGGNLNENACSLRYLLSANTKRVQDHLTKCESRKPQIPTRMAMRPATTMSIARDNFSFRLPHPKDEEKNVAGSSQLSNLYRAITSIYGMTLNMNSVFIINRLFASQLRCRRLLRRLNEYR